MTNPQAGKCILIVDDHPDTLALQALLLRRSGYEVETATSAADALAIAAQKPVDLIVSDVRLPDRNGFELMHELYEQYGLHGIALTGVSEEEADQARRDGCIKILIKPVDPDYLSQVIHDATRGQTPG